MRILQVSTAEIAGGAESVAKSLFEEYRRQGHDSWLAVGLKSSSDSDVLLIPNSEGKSSWSRLCTGIATRLSSWVGRVKGARRGQQLLENLSEPLYWLQRELGREYFQFPGSRRLLRLTPRTPDIIHCHNLHGPFLPGGGYFDLRLLPWMSRQVPLALTLHDAWLMSGHCAHSFDCDRWRTGCGICPDLSIYPAVKRDSTHYNWRRKQRIYAESRLFVVTPSRWLMGKVEQSILACSVLKARVIPNGLDLSVFRPGERQAARRELKIRSDAKVLLFTANHIRQNMWKDYQTVQAAAARVGERLPGHHVLLIVLGEHGAPQRMGQAEVRFVPYQIELGNVARYYQAAEIYVHAAKADTFPSTVLESLACGTPVVATAVGGIPEQVKGLKVEGYRFEVGGWELNGHGPDMATGILVPRGDSEGMAGAIEALLCNETYQRRLGENAAMDAQRRFDLKRQSEAYLNWYEEILEVWHRCGFSSPL